LINLGELAISQVNYSKAEDLLSSGLTLIREIDYPYALSSFLNIQGELRLKQENFLAATTAFEEARNISKKIGAKEPQATALYGLARTTKVEGNIAKAHQQGQEGLTIFETMGHYKATDVRQWLDTLPTENFDLNQESNNTDLSSQN
jgi:tetratricopeptide (TPR) repeat protein